MIQKIKNIVLVLSTLSLAVVPALAFAPSVAADVNINEDINCGTNFQIQNPGQPCQKSDNNTDLQGLLEKVVNIFSVIVGVIAVIMIIVGGLRYITSGGDSGKVSAAKTSIIYALVGLVIVALAQLIVHYVLSQAQGITGGGA